MTSDEARERFSAAVEGELEGAERAAFEAALEADSALRSDYGAFVEGRRILAATGQGPAPDILADVQHALHVRSGGMFYRDRFSRMSPKHQTTVVVLAMLVLLGIVLLGAVLHARSTDAVDPRARDPQGTTRAR
ncbi:MAG: hypothetical protein R3A78_07775 [Polyangiales bacterium]|nr:zf-HC2 domain-containing protein [Myxococcales bacterium]